MKTSLLLLIATVMASPNRVQSSVLDDYEQRLPALRQQIPAVVASAEAAAKRVVAEPKTSLALPSFNWSPEFADEFLSRAGGLAKAPAGVYKKGLADRCVVLVSTRNWESDAATVLPGLKDYRSKDYLVTVFGSRAGMPTNAVCDFLIDNGAAKDAITNGPANILANVTLGWMWTCEYAAALSRLGKYPGIYRSKALLDAEEHNKPIHTPEGRFWMGDTDKKMAAGKLSELYLDRVAQLVHDLHDPRLRASLDDAAAVVADRIRQGKTVYTSGAGHFAIYEMKRKDLRTPMQYCHPTKIEGTVRRGDLLVWIGYMGCVGLTRKGEDLLTCLKERGVDVVFCEAPLPSKDNTAPEVFAQVDWKSLRAITNPSPVVVSVDQSWAMPDAEVPIPWPPGRMAPVSGINAYLLLRLLDENVAARLARASAP